MYSLTGLSENCCLPLLPYTGQDDDTGNSEYLYLYAEDLYRLGNSTEPRLTNVRPDDILTYDRNGVEMVRATGVGISLSNTAHLRKREGFLKGWLWRIPPNTLLPDGLALRPDPRDSGHFFLCPVSDMTMNKYKALLSELALRCEKTRKI